jgi:hypothetical protein
MFLKSKFLRIVTALSLVLFFCAASVFADTIRLKDGSIIKGRIIGFRDGQFVVSIGDGNRARQMTFFADEVEAVEFDSTSLNANATTAATPIKLTSPNTSNATRPQTNTPANNSTVPANPTNSNAGLNNGSNTNVIIVGKTNNNNTPTPTNADNDSTNGAGSSSNSTTSTTTAPSYTNSTPNGNANANTIPVSTNSTTTPTTNTAPNRPKPIQLNVKVLADNTANGWTNTGFHVKKGQRFRVSGRGQISLGNGNFAKSEGIKSLADDKKLMPAEPTGGLIAVIGDDNNDFIFIGSGREFTASRDGMLFLGINENNLNDNSGSFEVTIEIEPIN